MNETNDSFDETLEVESQGEAQKIRNATRTDVHCPSSIDPAQYRYERIVYLWMSQDDALMLAFCPGAGDWWRKEQQEALDLVEREGWKGGNFASKRTCDHCGARFRYGMLYRHIPSNEIIVVGWICAGKTMEVDDRASLDRQRLMDRVANMRSKLKSLAAIARRKAELAEVRPEVVKALELDHRITKDIKARFDATGFLSEKQIALVLKLARERAEGKQEEIEPTWLPVTEGRREIEGQVLGTRSQDFGPTKMLLRVDQTGGAEKIWVTIPRAILGLMRRGDRVRLTATVKRSDRDATFGLGSRPTCAEVIAT